MIRPSKKAFDRVAKIEALEAIGGKRWTKDAMDRIYFDSEAVRKLIGLTTGRGREGNKGSFYKGVEISNSKAAKMIPSGKVYFDLNAMEFVGIDTALISIEI